MCGLAGVFTPRQRAPGAPNPERMLAALAHRGPDGSSRWESPDCRYLALFRRLAILDLATGDQPLHDDAGEFVLMGNGEIYNYLELRAACPDYPFRTQGDMETILPLARRRGAGFVSALNGMFALALYERMPHRLTLVRDRLGIKPLYWARTAGGSVVFASEIKAILASGLVAAAVDEDAVSAYLAHGYVPAPATLFAGIRKLPPAHRLTVEADGSERLERYWFPAHDAALPGDAPGIERYLVELLRDCVRLQLRSDVPLGALLSGGLDSGLMVALAASQTSAPIRTFTVRFEGRADDETPLARQVAERYRTDHSELDVSADDIGVHVCDLAWYMEEPLADASVLPNFLIERALARELKVALNGTGGDELFAGYPRYFQMPVERAYGKVPRWLRAGVVEPLVGTADPYFAWRLARAGKFESDRGAYLHEHSSYFPPPLRALVGNAGLSPRPAQCAPFAAYATTHAAMPDTAALYADLATYLPEDLLLLLDRTTMAVSVEGRVPYLDHRFVEAALSVPAHLRAQDGRQKALQRAMARALLPADVVAAPKRGFASPVSHWMQGTFGQTVQRLLTAPGTLARGWWSADGIRRLTAAGPRHAHRLYALAMLELAVRLLVERPVAATPPGIALSELSS